MLRHKGSQGIRRWVVVDNGCRKLHRVLVCNGIAQVYSTCGEKKPDTQRSCICITLGNVTRGRALSCQNMLTSVRY